MDSALNDWKGINSEVNFAVNSLISTIEEKFSLDEKTAKKFSVKAYSEILLQTKFTIWLSILLQEM